MSIQQRKSTSDPAYHYPGDELRLFADARNWKRYFAGRIRPFLKGRVVEAGAGIGATTKVLNEGTAPEWIMLEPDDAMFAALQKEKEKLPPNVKVVHGTVDNLANGLYDTILYIDVLEHIESDAEELRKAAGHLVPGGHLVVLSPAFQYLYSDFDKAIGHFIRYNKRTLLKAAPSTLKLKKIEYLDSTGYFASVANKLLLRQSYPTTRQVRFWDRLLVPISRLVDPLFFHSFGKSILAVWEKKA